MNGNQSISNSIIFFSKNRREAVKSILLVIIICFLGRSSVAQKTYVPDDAFESYIENYFNQANDGIANNDSVLTTGIEGALGITIYGIDYPVIDFTGIQDFTLLQNVTLLKLPVVDLDLSSLAPHWYWSFELDSCNLLETVTFPGMIVEAISIKNCPSLNEINAANVIYFNEDAPLPPVIAHLSVVNSGASSLTFSNNWDFTFEEAEIIITDNASLVELAFNGTNTMPATFIVNNNPNLNCIQFADTSSIGTLHWLEQTLFETNNPGVSNLYQAVPIGGCSLTSISELSTTPELLRITNLFGQEEAQNPGRIQLYHYSDGTIRKVFQVEDE